jgi:hypothetical protein
MKASAFVLRCTVIAALSLAVGNVQLSLAASGSW